jgi:hypothetical protein
MRLAGLTGAQTWSESLTGASVSSGYANSNFCYTSSGVVTSIGADANAPNGGRFISDLMPTCYGPGLAGGAYVSSKDHVAEYGYPVAGNVTVQVIRVRKQL